MVPATINTVDLRWPRKPGRRGRPASEQNFLLPQFISGEENQLIVFLCQQNESITKQGNPLLLHGPSGCGKTALAMTFAVQERERLATEPPESDGSIVYLPAVDFARRYAEAIEMDDLEHFRQQIVSSGCLIIDDVHAIVSKLPAQEELAARIEHRVTEQRPTIVTCRRLPTEIRGLRSYLCSRMLPGITIPIQLPGNAARIEIVRQLCLAAELDVDTSTIEMLSQGMPDHIPATRLSLAVNHLKLLRLGSENADLFCTNDALHQAINAANVSTDVTIAQIAKTVARQCKLKTSELKGSTRRQQVVRARALAMFLARRLTESSFHSIGEYFGGRDHTTVLHACRKTEQLLQTNNDLIRTADEVTEKLRQSA